MEKSEKSYFAASNSMYGFKSYFGDIFGTLDYLYIIKGGSGTGKSRFMREVANAAADNRERVEYFYCSSDPKSLDGIILCDRNIGIIDGTAPHTVEPTLPGCKEEIINLGEFLDPNILRSQRTYIEKLLGDKKALYKRAYNYLSIAGKCDRIADEIAKKAVQAEKLKKWAERFVSKLALTDKYDREVRIVSSISYMGNICFDIADDCETIYYISEKNGVQYEVMKAIYDAAQMRKISMRVSYTPLDPLKIDAIYFTDNKIAVTTLECKKNAEYETINTSRFVSTDAFRENRCRLRFLKKTGDALLDNAVDIMKEIFKTHSEIEKIYSSAMDFEKKEKCTADIIAKIWSKT